MNQLEQFTLASFMVIGFVNGVQLALNRDFKSFAMFITAVIIGGVSGALGMFGLPNLEMGLAVGISSSGIYKIAQKIGND